VLLEYQILYRQAAAGNDQLIRAAVVFLCQGTTIHAVVEKDIAFEMHVAYDSFFAVDLNSFAEGIKSNIVLEKLYRNAVVLKVHAMPVVSIAGANPPVIVYQVAMALGPKRLLICGSVSVIMHDIVDELFPYRGVYTMFVDEVHPVVDAVARAADVGGP
jgi:hypothetical protein